MSEEKKSKKSTQEEQSEVRYVPVEYMQGHGAGMPDDDEIDLMELAKKIWAGRRTIFKFVGLFIFLGLFVAIFSPEEFESDAILMPEAQQQQQGGASRLLQQFGGQFGISAGGDLSQGMIPPQLYPQIVNSTAFQLELLNKEIYFREYDVEATWPEFLENHHSKPLTSYLKEYTIGLPFTILGGVKKLFTDENLDEDTVVLEDDPLEASYIEVSDNEFQWIKNLKERISVSQDQETGLLTTKVKLQDPRAAAELNRFLIDRLKEYVTHYRLEKASQNLEFAEEQKNEAQDRFEKAQIALAEFRDRNVSLSTARAQTEMERLQDEKNLALNVYNSITQRYEESRLNLQEQTPIFTEVQSVNVPTQRSEPKRPLIMVVFTMLGVILGVGFVLVKPVFDSLITEMK